MPNLPILISQNGGSVKDIQKRDVEIVVISDVHLGTYGCRAEELLNYLKSINPEILILNGDIIDIWQFNKRYFPKSHMKVIKYFTSLLAQDKKVYYVTGNHDEMLRKFKGFKLGSLEIVNKLILDLDGKKVWIFHGDVFDVIMQYSKWLAKLGGKGYDILILVNTFVNWISKTLGLGKISLSKKIKNSVKTAVKYINNFEDTATDIALSSGYDCVICGHIHKPQMRKIRNNEGQDVMYLNSGDWVENFSALEYNNQEWKIYSYPDDDLAKSISGEEKLTKEESLLDDLNNKELFNQMLEDFMVWQSTN
jgi:UDP-2,3-diacylglucosamine pyrophosphatase LpxH